MPMELFIVLLICIAFHQCNSFQSLFNKISQTKLHENFNFDFKNPKIESDQRIFTEKQLTDFTSEYSVDDRFNPIELLLGLFKKPDQSTAASSSLENAIKPTVSLEVLEEKTAAFVKGKIDAKAYASILNAAFGSNLSVVLPEILANLPADKASALSKLTK